MTTCHDNTQTQQNNKNVMLIRKIGKIETHLYCYWVVSGYPCLRYLPPRSHLGAAAPLPVSRRALPDARIAGALVELAAAARARHRVRQRRG